MFLSAFISHLPCANEWIKYCGQNQDWLPSVAIISTLGISLPNPTSGELLQLELQRKKQRKKMEAQLFRGIEENERPSTYSFFRLVINLYKVNCIRGGSYYFVSVYEMCAYVKVAIKVL